MKFIKFSLNLPHQAAIRVSSHCCLLGRYSRKTAVSSTKLPPAPKADNETHNPSTTQFGEDPAMMAKIEHNNRDALKANFLPMMSALKPQNRAPTSIPVYAATVRPRINDGPNSRAAWSAVILWSRSIKESTAYLKTGMCLATSNRAEDSKYAYRLSRSNRHTQIHLARTALCGT